jgi:hypothetical protein
MLASIPEVPGAHSQGRTATAPASEWLPGSAGCRGAGRSRHRHAFDESRSVRVLFAHWVQETEVGG